MQLGDDFWKLAANIALKSQRSHKEIAASLHLRERTCQSIGEHDKMCIKNSMCTQVLKILSVGKAYQSSVLRTELFTQGSPKMQQNVVPFINNSYGD